MEKPSHPPVISFRDFEERKDEITKQVMAAAKTTGFFYAQHTGIDDGLILRIWEVYERFFAMTPEQKAALPQLDWGTLKLLGYDLNTDSDGGIVREAQSMLWSTPDDSPGWPDAGIVPGFKETTREFMEACPPVVDRIMSCFAMGLGWPEDYFKETMNVRDPDNQTVIQCNRYPPVEGLKCKAGTNRITPHTDEGMLTLLFTSPGSAGLELAAGKDGHAVDSGMGTYQVEAWHPCPPIPGCITINIGDPLQIWSDGVLKSNFHRVRWPKEGEPQGTRLSYGTFWWPRDNDVMEGPNGNTKYPSGLTHKEFMAVKSKSIAESLNRDPAVYESVQHLAYGLPHVIAAAS